VVKGGVSTRGGKKKKFAVVEKEDQGLRRKAAGWSKKKEGHQVGAQEETKNGRGSTKVGKRDYPGKGEEG